jgi:hypothetical protein
LKGREWGAINHHVSKRKRDGKESDLYIHGALVPQKKVRKETSQNSYASLRGTVRWRYCPQALHEIEISSKVHLAPSPALPNGVYICTPAASEADTLQKHNLPLCTLASFLEFQGNVKRATSGFPKKLIL